MTQSSSSTSPDKRPKKKSTSASSAKQQAAQHTKPASAAAKSVPRPSSSSSSSVGQNHESLRQQRETALQRSKPQRQKRKVRRTSHRGLWLSGGGTVIAVVGVIVLFIFLGHTTTNTSGAYPLTAADPTVIHEVTTVNPSALAAVGTGQVQTKPTKLNGASLLIGPTGKPEVFYQGAEYCPYCAAERWALIVALSRFGTFDHLSQITSSPTDVYPSTHSFSFYHSSYASQYIDFVPLEQESDQGVSLQTPTTAQQQLINQYNPNGGYPFIDIANKYTVSGAGYDPQVLSNLDWQSIVGALSNPQSPVAQGILGTANYLTAAICEATNQQPASVCQAAPIPQVQQALNASTGNTGLLGSFMPALAVESGSFEVRRQR